MVLVIYVNYQTPMYPTINCDSLGPGGTGVQVEVVVLSVFHKRKFSSKMCKLRTNLYVRFYYLPMCTCTDFEIIS